ncbi:GntP family permease [candidate division KSB1 bacterium]|nr:GntP family permease [candidate division KSB1 bacterium]
MLKLLLLLFSIVFIIFSTTRLRLHPFLALLFTSIGYGLASAMPMDQIIESINSGFGGTLGHIGIVIIAGTIIGTFLEKSGGAYALAETILHKIGVKRIIPAMGIIGYIVSIPVFADSGFVILSPLNKTLSKRAGISLAATAIVLSLCLTISHTLMPPTPGPIAAAGLLGADLGLVILFATPVSIIVMVLAWIFSDKVAKRVWIDPNPEVTTEHVQKVAKDVPGALKAVLPIFVPIALIVAKSIADMPSHPLGQGVLSDLVTFIGTPVIALFIGVILAFTLPKKLKTEMLSQPGWVGEALTHAAIIIMITGAGGVFGKMLQNSGIAKVIGDILSGVHLGLWLPFILAAAIKTAQGSSTVAIITTASIIAPLMQPLGYTSPAMRALVVLTIGSGAMVVSHANDSFFWVVTQMSNMDVNTGYKLHSLGTLVIGVCAALLVWFLSLFIS